MLQGIHRAALLSLLLSSCTGIISPHEYSDEEGLSSSTHAPGAANGTGSGQPSTQTAGGGTSSGNSDGGPFTGSGGTTSSPSGSGGTDPGNTGNTGTGNTGTGNTGTGNTGNEPGGWGEGGGETVEQGAGGSETSTGATGGTSGPSAPAGCREMLGDVPVCCTPGGTNRTNVDEVLELLNAYRTSLGLSALARDPELEEAMQGHCMHMALADFFAHESPVAELSTPWARAGYCGSSANGENIASGQSSPAKVMEAWRNSSGHDANMRGNYKRVGIGEYERRWGQLFGG